MYPEEEQKGVAIAHSLALEAWQVNGLTAHAPLVQQFDLLNGMGNIQVVNGRITFPGKIDRLSFDPNKLLMGVLGGTFENKDEETVVISYPHERQGEIKGKSQFWLKLDDATRLAKATGKVVGLTNNDIESAARTYTSQMSFAPENQEEYEQNIASSLMDRLQTPH